MLLNTNNRDKQMRFIVNKLFSFSQIMVITDKPHPNSLSAKLVVLFGTPLLNHIYSTPASGASPTGPPLLVKLTRLLDNQQTPILRIVSRAARLTQNMNLLLELCMYYNCETTQTPTFSFFHTISSFWHYSRQFRF